MMTFSCHQPYHSSTTSLLSSEGPKSLTRDSFFVDRVDKGVGDGEDREDLEEQEEAEELPEEITISSNKKGEKTMQVLGMSPPVSEARLQMPFVSVNNKTAAEGKGKKKEATTTTTMTKVLDVS